ncbi:MAG: hypothetical protein ACR2PG_23825 [Hyphomicrobiaceae bacterium]
MDRAQPDTRRLRSMWWTAVGAGTIAFLLSLLWANSSQGPGLDWVWVLAAFGASVIAFNVAFFGLCSYFTPYLSTAVRDGTEIEGDTVVHVVQHAQTGDEKVDFYVRAYATARGVTAVGIVTGIMIAIALLFF